jgi:hypothetical protein
VGDKMPARPVSLRLCTWGDLGSGKTISLVIEALRWKKAFPDGVIYSNIPLVGVDFEPLKSAGQLFDLKGHLFLLLDELWHLADSRRSLSLVNDVMSMLLLRSDKQGWSVGYSQQWYMQTDLRIRFITSLWIEPYLYPNGLLRQYVYDKEGNFLCSRYYDARLFWDSFDTSADPFTLDLDELKRCYEVYKEKRLRGYV